MSNCNICGRTLDNPEDPTTTDCGGDCLRCMAEFGDPGCIEGIYNATRNQKWLKEGLAMEPDVDIVDPPMGWWSEEFHEVLRKYKVDFVGT